MGYKFYYIVQTLPRFFSVAYYIVRAWKIYYELSYIFPLNKNKKYLLMAKTLLYYLIPQIIIELGSVSFLVPMFQIDWLLLGSVCVCEY